MPNPQTACLDPNVKQKVTRETDVLTDCRHVMRAVAWPARPRLGMLTRLWVLTWGAGGVAAEVSRQ